MTTPQIQSGVKSTFPAWAYYVVRGKLSKKVSYAIGNIQFVQTTKLRPFIMQLVKRPVNICSGSPMAQDFSSSSTRRTASWAEERLAKNSRTEYPDAQKHARMTLLCSLHMQIESLGTRQQGGQVAHPLSRLHDEAWLGTAAKPARKAGRYGHRRQPNSFWATSLVSITHFSLGGVDKGFRTSIWS
ncbi:hypothetical protein DL95DRAFT_10503 [Leptodontidium sp. 2 PMI_412]|nr:hypothetical protein DL95DRAFT_10503 [Leptodontidium sp. 2 PMI_412]